jgi:hypothetical protein
LFATAAGYLVAIDDGESDVEQNDVGMMLTRQIEGFLSVERSKDLLPQSPEQPLKALGIASLIIDDQDPPARKPFDAVKIGLVESLRRGSRA